MKYEVILLPQAIVSDVVRVLHVRGFGQDLIEPDQF
jgi:hypothetical protein